MEYKFINEFRHLNPNILDEVNSLGDLTRILSKIKTQPYYEHFVGFLWEFIIGEYFTKFGEHVNVNVCDYQATYAGSTGIFADYGVDGFGGTINYQKKILCQIKYRANPFRSLKANDVSALDTFIRQVYSEFQQNNSIEVLICSTTNEQIGNQMTRKAMNNCGLAKSIHKKLEQLYGVPYQSISIRVYDSEYWSKALDNIRFWATLRSRL